jgi:hypothetical protein
MIADTIIRQSEALPTDIILYMPDIWSLAFPMGEQETNVIIGTVTATIDSKLKRWSGSEWIKVGTLIVYN